FTVTQKPLTRVSQISTGFTHTCAISATSELYCWGAGADGRLGLGGTTDRNTPIRVGADIDWAQVSAGIFSSVSAHTCAVSTGGQLYCWGESDDGRLGLGSEAEDQDTPTRVGAGDTWSQVSAGTRHTCAVNTDGELYCWGVGTDGRLGTTGGTDQDTPARVGEATDWKQVGTGNTHTCAINTSGQLHCWGENSSGQLGLGDTTDRTTPARVGTDANWLQLSVGNNNTCAVNDIGQLFCWGSNSSGQLGLGVTTQNISSPSRVGTDANWFQVSAGAEHTCAVNTGGELYCWGVGFGNSRLGLGTLNFSGTPARVGTNWSQTSAGGNHTCAVNEIGQLHCWGESDNGRLGLGTTEDRNTPTAVIEPPAPATTIPNLANVVLTNPNNRFEIAKLIPPIVFTNSGGDVQAGGCAVGTVTGTDLPAGLRAHPVLSDGTVTCQIIGVPTAVAATSTYHLTATNAVGNNSTPATVSFEVFATAPFVANIPNLQIFEKDVLIEPITFTNTGLNVQASGCTVDPDLPAGLMLAVYEDAGTMTCQITGTPTTVTARQAYTVTATSSNSGTDMATVSIDVRLKLLNSATQITVGSAHTCAISADGELFCWGSGNSGRLGLGSDTSNRNTPHLVGSATNWAQISTGNSHTCAINTATTGQLYCWGAGNVGQLGRGDKLGSNTPAQVESETDWVQVSAGSFHTCAINAAGELYCWGRGNSGQLGTGAMKEDSLTPAQVGSAADWTQVSTNAGLGGSANSFTCAINALGQLHCWGRNTSGQLGLGDKNERTTPARVGMAIDWMQISAGGRHACAINTAGQLHCWGEGGGNQLGLGGTDDMTDPTRVGMAADWTQVNAGDTHTCAINTAGQLHCWGSNTESQLGLGSVTSAPTPFRVGNATNWTQVNATVSHTCAINSSNQLHCWGNGGFGRLGLGDDDFRTTPETVTPVP
nr:hypothetical protein [Pseudomonadota bacterium]